MIPVCLKDGMIKMLLATLFSFPCRMACDMIIMSLAKRFPFAYRRTHKAIVVSCRMACVIGSP